MKIRQTKSLFQRRAPAPVGTAAICPILCGVLAVAALAVSGCSAPPAQQVVLKGMARTAPSHFYPQSLRYAARGRVQARAGDDALAAEYFRAAYHQHPDIQYLLSYARACERAKYFNEARQAYQEALTHDLDEDESKRVKSEVERLATLISKTQVPVTLQIRPRNARAIVSSPADKASPQPASFERVVMGDAKIFLKPGKYTVHVAADTYRGQLRSFRVRPGNTTSSQGQLIAVTLRPEAKVPLALSQHRGSGATATSKNVGKSTRKTADNDDDDDDEEVADADTKGDGTTGDDTTGSDGSDGSDVDDAVDAGVADSGGSGGSSLHKWGPIATAGVGVLALGAGGGLWYLAMDEAALAEAVNPAAGNRTEIFEHHRGNAELYWNMRIVAFGVGGALVAAGTIWMAVAPKNVALAPANRGLASTLRPADVHFDGRTFGATWRF